MKCNEYAAGAMAAVAAAVSPARAGGPGPGRHRATRSDLGESLTLG